MKTKLAKLTGLLALSVAGVNALVSCGGGGSEANTPVYTINFYAEGSKTVIQPIKAHAGETITAPSKTPTKSGFKFMDWHETYHSTNNAYTHSDSEKAFDWSKGMPAKNITLYAHWAKEGGSDATEEEVEKYMADLKENSQPNHLYFHYYRYGNEGYNDWDIWAWPYKPTAGEGTRIDWNGRTTSSDRMSATGDATYDKIGGTVADIDLTKTYKSGWDNKALKMLDIDMSFEGSTQIGIQVVKSSTRSSDSGFWVNDGDDNYIILSRYAMELNNGGTAYHVFTVQDMVSKPSKTPITNPVDPFEDDDGSNVTYGNSAYDTVDWNASIGNAPTASDFKSVGAGYQIQISSYADSDGDGFGDIYGIIQKLDYIKDLGVKALWLTPVQLSSSYHGYDITDYKKVDPKFGSSVSPAGAANGGVVSEDTALEDYKLLLKEANDRGIKVVMDLVLNHTSTANNWYTSSANLDADYRGYYQWGNHVTDSSDPAYAYSQAANINENKYWYPYGNHPYSYYAKFGSAMPELNYSYQATREAVEDMSAYWVNLGVSGFRLDAVKHIYMLDEAEVRDSDTTIIDETTVGGRQVSYSSNLTKNLNFFKELKYQVAQRTGKDVFFVGENFDGHAYHVAPYYEAFDSMFDFYAYFNLTSGAATGKKGTTSAFGTVGGWMYNPNPQESSKFRPGTVAVDTDGNISGDAKGKTYVVGSNAAGSDFDIANGQVWDFVNVYNTYNAYRQAGGGNGQVSLPGAFTSNHDIARVINRIAGTGSSSGLKAQGNITSSNYAEFERSAMLVKIAEVLLPGVTWIYYGDEIGMTGNFPDGTTSQSDYCDLWYRQPMKWATSGNAKGDANGTTDYYVTGSKMKVEWDNVNATSTVKGALEQHDDNNSDYNVLARFIKAKNNAASSLVTGNIGGANWVWGNLAANTLCFSRDNDNYRVVVNFSSQAAIINDDNPFANYESVVSYNGATTSSIPAFSAILMKKK